MCIMWFIKLLNKIAIILIIVLTVKGPAGNAMDDMIVVNGTHMSEEAISARILQSLSQKAVYHHTSSNVSSNVSSNGVAVYRNIQTVPTTYRSSQPAVHVHITSIFICPFTNLNKICNLCNVY